MIETACTCDDLPAHSHVGEQITFEHPDGRRATIPAASLAAPVWEPWAEVERIPEHIRIWVDWKAVARRLSADPATPEETDMNDERDPVCVSYWPECRSGEFDPRCCRFPKSCSCERVPVGPVNEERPQ